MIYKISKTESTTSLLDKNDIGFNKVNSKKIIFEQSVNKLNNRFYFNNLHLSTVKQNF